MTRFLLALLQIFVALLVFSSVGHADMRWIPGATCLIEITNGAGGDHYTRWTRGQLGGAAGCVKIGQQVDYDNPPYPNRDVCVCIGGNYGQDNNRAVVLCSDRGNLPGPRDSRVARWCGPPASSPPPNVAGSWTCRGSGCCRDGGRTTIVQSGSNLTLTNECTPPSTTGAHFVGTTTIMVDRWPVRGTLSSDGRTIDWGNGSRWVR
jgi:hypothetical protein